MGVYIVPILFIELFAGVIAVGVWKICRYVKFIYECLESYRCDYGAEEGE